MPGWVRKGDANEVGGRVIANTASTVYVNGKLAALKGSLISTHNPSPDIHEGRVIQDGSGTVIVEGKPAAFKGAHETCSHTQVEASSDVIIPGG